MKIHWTNRSLFVLLMVMGANVFVTACERNGKEGAAAAASKQTGIVAGYGEKTFTERYHLKLKLPMSEANFLALLHKLGLNYGVCGERGGKVGLPTPRHPTTVDLSGAQKCYEVYGDLDPIKHIGKGYRVFVDKNHRVIYIENVFAYTGP